MRVQIHAAFGIAGVAALAIGLGCSSNNGTEDGGASTSGLAASGSTGNSGFGSGTSGSGALVRLANLSAGSQGIDLCVAVHGSGQFQGPLLADLQLTSGAHYTDVSTYFGVPAGAVDLRVVAAGTECTVPLSGSTDLTDLPPLAAGAGYTVAEIPHATPPTQIFEDDLVTGGSVAVALRFLDVSSTNPTLDLGSVQGSTFTPWITGVQFLGVGGTAQQYSLDANGYLDVPATRDVLLRIEYQSQDLLDLAPEPGASVALSSGSLYTLFALPGTPLAGLLCDDQVVKQTGYTACTLYPIPESGSATGTTTGGSSTGTSGGSTSGGSTTGGSTSGGSTTGTGPTSDGGSTDDGGSVSDGGSTDDGGSVSDGGSTDDGGSVSDGGATDDGGSASDGGSESDGGTSSDGGSLPDGGLPG